jgi:hypothetical protein
MDGEGKQQVAAEADELWSRAKLEGFFELPDQVA